jgi:ABC-type transport system involved in multi-copper enzyme maturation permease subunit
MNYLEKEFKEIWRNKFLVMISGIICLSALFIFLQIKSLHFELTIVSFLLPLFKINIYFIPIIAMIAGAFSVHQDIANKTLDILLSRFVTPFQYILQKTLSINLVISALFVLIYFIIYVIISIFIETNWLSFFYFLISIIILGNIFIQIGCYLGSLFHERMKLISAVFGVWFSLIFLYDLILIYLIPVIDGENILFFTASYFLSPIKTVDYFLMIKLGIYNSYDIHAILNLLSFQHPFTILLIVSLLWLVSMFILSYTSIKRRR